MQIFKRKGRPCYYARWQRKGKDFLRSTGKTNERLALEEAKRLANLEQGKLPVDDYFDQLKNHFSQPVSIDDRKKSIERLSELIRILIASEREEHQLALQGHVVRQLQSGQQQRIAIEGCWAAWSENANRKYEPKASTLRGYQAIWRRFEGWATKEGVTFLHEVTPDQCLAYSSNLWCSKVSPSTFNQHVAFLKAMSALLEEGAGLVNNPWTKINKKQKNKNEGRRNLSEDECSAPGSGVEYLVKRTVGTGVGTADYFVG